MAGPTPIAFPLGRLRLEIDGAWTALEFADLLGTLDQAYLASSCSQSLSDLALGSPYFWSDRGRYERPPPVETVEQFAQGLFVRAGVLYGDLAVEGIEYGSPGWVQVLGSWNPLKVLADFVTAWRAENSQRRRDEAADRQADREANLRETAQQQAFELGVLEQLGQMPAHLQASMLDQITSRWPRRELTALARDSRVGEITVTQVESQS